MDLSHFSLYFVSNLSTTYYSLKVLMCSCNNRNCIVDKSLKIIKLMKNAVRLILDNFNLVPRVCLFAGYVVARDCDNFGIVGFLVFGRIFGSLFS